MGIVNEAKSNRIGWVDWFRAIAIIIVVLGHTDTLNIYNYQFHMAAFFLISGYTSGLERRGFWETAWNKMCTLLLPLTTLVILFTLVVTALNFFGIYDYFFSSPFVGTGFLLKQYFSRGALHIEWLGATWFIKVLFGVSILHKLLFTITKNRVNSIYCFLSILFYVMGWYATKVHVLSILNIDLILIGQFYFFVGVFLRNKNTIKKVLSNNLINIVLLGISIIILWYFGNILLTTVDYPSRRFGSIILCSISALNGCLFLYLISFFGSKLPKSINQIVTFISTNTIAIIVFHFAMFKISYFILYLCGIQPISVLQNFTPSEEIKHYWLLTTTISILASLGLWRLISIPRFMKIALGQSKETYGDVFKQIASWDKWDYINEIMKTIKDKIMGVIINISKFIQRNKFLIFVLIIFTAAISSALIKTGIMLNDELQFRFYGIKGFTEFFKYFLKETIDKGRALSAVSWGVLGYVNYASSFIYYYEIINLINMLINNVLFCYIIYKIFKSKEFSIFLSVMLLALLPVSFEHTMPNAYNGIYMCPFSFLLVSFILFIMYLETEGRKPLIISMILLFITLTGYEIFITFTPFYLVLIIHFSKTKKLNFYNIIKKLAMPFAVSILYLGAYIVLGIIYPTIYPGTKLTFVSMNSSFNVIKQLMKSGLPNYYLLNKKYIYLWDSYSDGSIFGLFNAFVSRSGLKIALGRFLINAASIRIFIVVIALLVILYLFVFRTKYNSGSVSKKQIACSVIVGICFMILPGIPTSLAQMYQDSVNPNAFAALPGTYFIYFASIFIVTFLIWSLSQKIKSNAGNFIMIICIIIFVLPTQLMNDTFSNEQSRNYNRLTTMERLIESNTFKQFASNRSVFAENLFEQRNTLAIHGSYWTDYANLRGIETKIINEPKQQGQAGAYFQEDKYFTLVIDNVISVLSPQPLYGDHPVRIEDAVYYSANFENSILDNTFYTYYFKIEDHKLTPLETGVNPYGDICLVEAGSTLSSAVKMYGYHGDGWIQKDSEYKLLTQSEGKVIISGYYPFNIDGSQKGIIYINDDPGIPFDITTPLFTIELDAPADQTVTVKIQNDFRNDSRATSDIRELCFILTELTGK